MNKEVEIPKLIHYCWFGGNPLPDDAKKCINSWKKFCPDYKIIEWNENNFDINCCDYIQQAYKEKKWAFVSDYARFWILYNYGGLYFDTDVELIKPIDDILEKGSFMGTEKQYSTDKKKIITNVNPGLGLAVYQNHKFLKQMLDIYNTKSFIKNKNEIDYTTIVELTTDKLIKEGFKKDNTLQKISDIYIYPIEFFCPLDYYTGELNITEQTKSIHHYTATWKDHKQRKQLVTIQKINRIFGMKIGHIFERVYTFPYRIFKKIKNIGIADTTKFIFKKIVKHKTKKEKK